MKSRIALTLAFLTLAVAAVRPAQTPAAPPRLVVLLVVDQFRGDYPEMYGRQWTRGLARIFSDGAVFTHAAYPYSNTVTCAGHATIATGALPPVHGMIGNSWYDPDLRRTVLCSNDPGATSVPFGGGTGTEHQGPHSLLVPTFADELRRQARQSPRIVSISLKPRSAIGLAGHGGPGTMVLWEEDNGTWATSDAYTKTPWPVVDEYVRAHPIASAYGQVWTRLLPESAYLYDDDGAGEATPKPWGRTFPHPLDSPTRQPDATFVSSWERSPWSDAYIGDLVMTLLARLRLGQDTGTDLVAISFSALDLVGHEYGPRSHEVQDVMARLDGVIGALLDTLDRTVGRDNYVLAMSADHGVAVIPEQASAMGLDAGVIRSNDLRQATQAAVAGVLGGGVYVTTYAEENLYLTPGTVDRLRATPGGIDLVRTALLSTPGLARIYAADELSGSAPTDDSLLAKARLSYRPGRSGDLVVILKPNWIVHTATGTTHGSPYDYDEQCRSSSSARVSSPAGTTAPRRRRTLRRRSRPSSASRFPKPPDACCRRRSGSARMRPARLTLVVWAAAGAATFAQAGPDRPLRPANGRQIIASAAALGRDMSDAAALAELRAWNQVITEAWQAGELTRVAVEEDALVTGRRHERFQQTYGGVPIWGGVVRRQVNSFGQTESIFGTYYPDVELEITPAIAGSAGATLEVLPTDRGFRLTWATRAGSDADGDTRRTFTDAQSGLVIFSYGDSCGRPAAAERTAARSSSDAADPTARARSAVDATAAYYLARFGRKDLPAADIRDPSAPIEMVAGQISCEVIATAGLVRDEDAATIGDAFADIMGAAVKRFAQSPAGGEPVPSNIVTRMVSLAVDDVGAEHRDQIERVIYRAFTMLLPARATLAMARAATVQAALDLYGADTPAARAFARAWTAVGVGSRP
ncbi:MAG: alkaline phosphatase family protein [Vicinamibacterales bacterium]